MAYSYLSVEEFRDETIMPGHEVDAIHADSPKWLQRQLEKKSAWIDARLRKRYAAPFAAPYPDAAKDWLTRIVTHVCYLRRGVDPTDAQMVDVKDDRATAEAEVQEAADSKEGLFDLPLRPDTEASGVTKQAARVSSQASPYAWTKDQRTRARTEDSRG